MENKTAFSEFRKTSGKTLSAVAEMFGVDRKTILRWEQGTPPVPARRIPEISQITGIPKDRLVKDVFGAREAAE